MKSFSRYVVCFSLSFCLWSAAIVRLPAAETAARQPAFSAQQQAARQKILDSDRWKETREKFKQWTALQIAEDPQQLAQQEARLKGQIASMSATQLKQFLNAMEERLEILLSPEMDQARGWVDHYYTPKAQRKMAQKLGVAKPLGMSGDQIKAALARFEEQRAAQAQSSAAFNRSRQSENKALQSYRAKQQADQARARSAQHSATFSSHAPKVTRSQQTRYPSGFRGGWGGWGGW